jgi:signal transduction histidine kinase
MTPRARAGRLFRFAITLLVFSGLASYVCFSFFRASERWVAHTQEVRGAVGDFEATVNQAGRVRLNYLLSGDEAELGRYQQSVTQIPIQLERLKRLTQDNAVQVKNCENLQRLTDQRLQLWNQSIQERNQNTPLDLASLLRQNLVLSSQTSVAAEQIRAEETLLLEQRTSVAHGRFVMATTVVIASFVLALLMLSAHYKLLMAELEARESAEQTIRVAYVREAELRKAKENEVAERTRAEERLASSERSLRQLSLHLLRTQDDERRRIGRELHDSLGQYLAMLKLNIESIKSDLGSSNGSSQEQIGQCVRLADESIKEVRTISYLLYPPMLEEVGLKSAIPWYLEGFSGRSNIQTTFELDPGLGRLQRDTELALFRVLQESLTNVHRHSGSQTAAIKLVRKDGFAVLEIQDRGKGISPSQLEKSGSDWMGSMGVGLRGMNERMQQLGGTLEVTCNETGTIVVATAPLEETASASIA